MAGILSRTLERLSVERTEVTERADDGERAGCAPIAAASDRARVSIHGVLRTVALRPVDGVTALEAELDDGTDTVRLVWLGRRRIVGVTPGRRLTARGRISCRDGAKVLYNPAYELDA